MAQAAFEEESARSRGQQSDGTSAAAAASGSVVESGGAALQAQMEAPLQARQQQAAGPGGQPLPMEAEAADAQEGPPKPAASCTRPAAPAAAAEQETPPQAASSWLPQLPSDWRHLLPGGAAASKPSEAARRAGPQTVGRHASKGGGPPPEVEMQALNDSSSLSGQGGHLLSAEGQRLCRNCGQGCSTGVVLCRLNPAVLTCNQTWLNARHAAAVTADCLVDAGI